MDRRTYPGPMRQTDALSDLVAGSWAADCASAVCCHAVHTDAPRVCALILAMAGGSGACLSGDAAGASRMPRAVPADATIRQLMSGQVDPAADALWNSVATIVSATGIEERRP